MYWVTKLETHAHDPIAIVRMPTVVIKSAHLLRSSHDLTSGNAALAQKVTVQIIDGRSGKPMSKIRVYIAFDAPNPQQTLDLRTNRQGEVQFEAAPEAKTFQVHAVGVVLCGEQPIGAPWRNYPIDEIMKSGLLTQNNCGLGNYEPLRGRLSYFARRASWWEWLKI